MYKLTAVCLAALLAESVFGAGINDALVYDMALVPTEGTVPTTAIYNRLTHSAATRATATSVSTFSGSTETCGTPSPVTIVEQDENLPVYDSDTFGHVTVREPAIHFPQSLTNVNGTIYAYRQGLKFDNMPVSSNMTVYLRMWLDPSIRAKDAQGASTGYGASECYLLDFNRVNGAEGGATAKGFTLALRTQYDMSYLILRHGYYQSTQWGGYVAMLDRNVGNWFDIALVLETDEIEQKTYVRVYGRYVGGKFGRQDCGVYADETVSEHLKHIPGVLRFNSKTVTMGVSVGDAGKTAWQTLSATNALSAFRGKCSRFRIYNRPLTTEEIRGLFTEVNGGAIQVGTANGTTEECAAADDAEAAAVYNPLTMPSSKMRGILTADHPSLTIDVPSKGADAGMCKLLTVKPIMDALGSGTPSLRVAVNGQDVDTLDFRGNESASLYIRGKYIATNANGVVRYTLTRTGDLSGSLGIDAFEIAGSWGEGAHHESGETKPEPTHTIITATDNNLVDTYLGHPSATYYMNRSLWGVQNKGTGQTLRPTTAINFYVPEDIALNRETAYTFGFWYAERWRVGLYPLMDVYLNGVKYGNTVNPYGASQTFRWTFPAGTLKTGYNTLVLSNATTSASLVAEDYYATIHADFHRFSVKPPPNGLMLIVR